MNVFLLMSADLRFPEKYWTCVVIFHGEVRVEIKRCRLKFNKIMTSCGSAC